MSFVKRRIVLWSALLLAVIGAATFVVRLNTADTPAPASAIDVVKNMRRCGALQGAAEVAQPEAVDCYRDTLRSALLGGQYEEVFAVIDELRAGNSWAACHAAGHQLGEELITEDILGFDEAAAALFGGVPRPVDWVCTASIVHGLVQGSVSGEPPYDLRSLADSCLALEAVDPSYLNECAHYFGHAAWKQVEQINMGLVEVCDMLGAAPDYLGFDPCMTGATMTKFHLQDALYGDGQQPPPPPYTEIEALCDAYEGQAERVVHACWGGAGWLLANRVDTTLQQMSGATTDAILAVYVDGLSRCRFDQCLDNFMSHLRTADYHNGVAERLCASPELPVNERFTREGLARVCDIFLSRRQGT